LAEITYKVSKLMKNRAALVVVIIGTGCGQLGESVEAVVGAWYNNFGAWDGAITEY
jgi:hypothetical protein